MLRETHWKNTVTGLGTVYRRRHSARIELLGTTDLRFEGLMPPTHRDTYRGECRCTCQHPDKSACRMQENEPAGRVASEPDLSILDSRFASVLGRHLIGMMQQIARVNAAISKARVISSPKLQRACSMVKMVCSADKCRAKILATVFPRAGDRRFSSASR